ncbi:TIGR03619 family F420-dependent LLM class oxidoreductase [Nocardia sp. NPDC057227]|uniref:TIGR03619 family F420-dependent LLM class oxidoreductase n=1 Tax=Nocardia sp. NPDC057227 TaxID=3346056 RepID=UPI00362AAA1C
MKFSVSYPTPIHGADPDALVTFARHVEACGFEGLYVPDHVALYPGARIGGSEVPTTLPFPDPLEILTFAAAHTDRLLLGTGVLLLPYRHPILLAKRLATLDLLSKGRLRLLTVGVGGLPGEAAALGVDYATRGRRADEALDVLRLLWSGGPDGVEFHGEFFDFAEVCVYPKPSTAEFPLHIGGSSPAAARRAGRRGNGYFAGGTRTPDERARQITLARAEATAAGRDPARLEYTRWGSTALTPDDIAALTAEGVDRIVVNASLNPLDAQLDELSAFAELIRDI